jgi:hypothetical protein
MDEHPAEISGWGHVHAGLARRMVRDHTAAEWRYALTDDDGRLLDEGIARVRPDGYPARTSGPCRGGIVELQIKLSDLRGLRTRPARLGVWAPVIADLGRQSDRYGSGDLDIESPSGKSAGDAVGDRSGDGRDRGDRFPARPLRRHTQIRDRTCTFPGCRVPAHSTDGDHTRDWADGGATTDDNMGSVCRHDHMLKHEGGWLLTQPAPGHFLWTSRLGRRYHVQPPLIIQSLPGPVPRRVPAHIRLAPRHNLDRDDPDADDDSRTSREPAVGESAPEISAKPGPAADIPPF